MYTQKEGHVKTHRESGHLQAKERRLRRNQPFRHFDLGLPASRAVRKYILFFKSQQSVVICYGSPSILIQYPSQSRKIDEYCP